ncbi:MAG: DNA topoisomerase VI subunit B [Candidatus Bathyarchaeota archaeon]|nr:MAG: DNA topoisomerase VI subunit B [Candidatus Bathyarchaeota archaeon]
MSSERYETISPADFFYRNRDIAGFSNPTRAVYSSIRELVENSLDACEAYGIPPDIYIRLSLLEQESENAKNYYLRVEDNGSGVPPEYIPSAFGQVLFGSKYSIRQMRGTFGLGGKMAILYGQITTHEAAEVISSTGTTKVYSFKLMIDIQRNRPNVLSRRVEDNPDKWHGTVVQFSMEGDYQRAMPKILDYLKESAIVSPYANITFVDPKGRLYKFDRATEKMPSPPTETLPHPHGVDVETLRRLIELTETRSLSSFMNRHFLRVGATTAKKFLDYTGIDAELNPKKLTQKLTVKLVQDMKSYNEFLPPDASCLSPVGVDLLTAGIRKELNPEFVVADQRRASAYSGFPFIVECAIAYGGEVPKTGDILLYRYANRIPLLYDEATDVSWKVIHNMINWRNYRVTSDMPIAIFTHVCSTKIPYKTVGKEYIADRPEIEKELLNCIRGLARNLAKYLSKIERHERDQMRQDLFKKYLPKIAKFSSELAGKEKVPDIETLMGGKEELGKQNENDS